MESMKNLLNDGKERNATVLSGSNDRRRSKTKKAIHGALLQLLQIKTLSEMTIKELTEVADVNRKTFYNHYTCLEDVIHEIESNISDRIKKILTDQTEPIIEQKWDSVLFIDKITSEIYNNRESIRILMNGNTNMRLFSKENGIMYEVFEIIQQQQPDFFKNMVTNYEIISSTIFTIYQVWITSEPAIMNKEELSQFIKEYILFCRNFKINEVK